MRWQKSKRSKNVEDRRGRGGAARRGAKLGGGAIILALVAAFLLGENPLQILEMLGGAGAQVAEQGAAPPADDTAADFVSAVLGDTEETWGALFRQAGGRYPEPILVLYEEAVQSACGFNSAATGPFYCPGDNKVYLDLSFFRQLQRMGADGDFAIAYVIAHEVGHHIQNVAGTEEQVRRLQGQVGRAEANHLSVMMELQADCYAGVWAHHAERQRDLLEQGDLEEGLRAAAAVGDDRLQKMAGQRVQPESFTHGTSAQRVEWFRRGLEAGAVDACDTFSATRR